MRFIECDADRRPLSIVTQIHSRVARRGGDFTVRIVLECDGVEKFCGGNIDVHRFQSGSETRSQPMHAQGNAQQTLRPVIHGVHACHNSEQHLRSTNIAGRFFAANVLLTGLQCEAIRRLALRVNGHTRNASGHIAFVRIARGHVSGVRPAIAHGYAEALRSSNDDVRAPNARRFEQNKRERISGANEQCASGMSRCGRRCHVVNLTRRGRVLREHGEVIARFHELGCKTDFDFDAQRLSARLHAINGLRMAIARDDDGVARRFRLTFRQRHRLGSGSAFVEQRRVGNVHAGQVTDHRLIVQQRLKTAL